MVTEGCDLVHQSVTLKAWRDFHPLYTMHAKLIHAEKLRNLLLTKKRVTHATERKRQISEIWKILYQTNKRSHKWRYVMLRNQRYAVKMVS